MIRFTLDRVEGRFNDGLFALEGRSNRVARLEEQLQRQFRLEQRYSDVREAGDEAVAKLMIKRLGAIIVESRPTANEPGRRY